MVGKRTKLRAPPAPSSGLTVVWVCKSFPTLTMQFICQYHQFLSLFNRLVAETLFNKDFPFLNLSFIGKNIRTAFKENLYNL